VNRGGGFQGDLRKENGHNLKRKTAIQEEGRGKKKKNLKRGERCSRTKHPKEGR